MRWSSRDSFAVFQPSEVVGGLHRPEPRDAADTHARRVAKLRSWSSLPNQLADRDNLVLAGLALEDCVANLAQRIRDGARPVHLDRDLKGVRSPHSGHPKCVAAARRR
jgi:hypothetical protein